MLHDGTPMPAAPEEASKFDWRAAKAHFFEVREPFLAFPPDSDERRHVTEKLNPLIHRFNSGERSQELFDAMMALPLSEAQRQAKKLAEVQKQIDKIKADKEEKARQAEREKELAQKQKILDELLKEAGIDPKKVTASK